MFSMFSTCMLCKEIAFLSIKYLIKNPWSIVFLFLSWFESSGHIALKSTVECPLVLSQLEVTRESPRAHVAKLYGRLRLIRSVLRASKFFVLKIDWNCNFRGLLHLPFWLQLVMALWGITFQRLKLLCLAKDHWQGFSTRNAHMVHIVN